MREKRTKFRHVLFVVFFRWIITLYLRIHLGWRRKKTYRLPKNGAIILSNHQTDFDPVMISTMFNRPIYYVCTDSVFSNKKASRVLNYLFAPIPKKKGAVDPNCVRQIVQTIKENGCVGIFPEGNRTIAEFQFEIDNSIVKLIKKLKVDLYLCNLCGGTAVYPRFASAPRKGKITGEVKRILKPEEYLEMSDEDLLSVICENLRVFDSINGEEIKSDNSAEYLERILFVCPKCGAKETIYTVDNHVCCSKCDLDVIYNKKSHFESKDNSFEFKLILDWYNYQKNYIKEMNIGEECIFSDKDVLFYSSEVNVQRTLLASGNLHLYTDRIEFGDISIPIKDIEIASVISGNKFNFTASGKSYLVKGHLRFNALKYVMMLNRLDTQMKENKADHFFNLD